MITYHPSDIPPQIVVEAEGSLSGPEVRRVLAPMHDQLRELQPGFVIIALYPDLVMLKGDAIEALFYYIARVFDADPGLFVMVDGNHSPHPGLRAFVEQLSEENQVQFVATREEGEALIDEYVNG